MHLALFIIGHLIRLEDAGHRCTMTKTIYTPLTFRVAAIWQPSRVPLILQNHWIYTMHVSLTDMLLRRGKQGAAALLLGTLACKFRSYLET